ncbi:hypothetical protein EW026_g2865 [Hermanssonia centrifuga]|uniref:Yeast cell wall synthesis Kre9/Knh1-like N-terminal domain-containing protein n=1 Tax=Hermanssonia centrifuga TaxID=98765 RepID=A0A4S4KRI8_9APHY|nr:hypothetical protein EW026_g2865 [Hermanssonia centrifuga]
MFASVFALVAIVPSALAAISITAPVASTSWAAGQQQTLTWVDDGQSPSLANFSSSMVSIYAGNAIQQTQLQLIVPSVDVSTTGSISFTPDPSIGPNGNAYFIRFESLSLKDATNPQFPAEAFSAKFTLTGMTGTFNQTVQAEVDGASTAPIGGATSAPASGATSSPPAATNSKPTSTSTVSSAASGSPTGATNSNGASGLAASFGVIGSVVLASAMML